jgi:hypothetical protein
MTQLLLRHMSYSRHQSHSGQAGLMGVAVVILLTLVIGGATLSNFSTIDSKRNIVDRRSMQAYYVAQAGLQEALATRMLPRSNYLNFYTPANTPKPVLPYYNNSGLVFQNPLVNAAPNTDQKLLGVYRYLIVGGDPSRKADGSYYGIPPGPPFSPANSNVTSNGTPTPRLVTFQSNPPASPFYVISNGFSCVKGNNGQGTDQGINQFMGSAAFITSAKQLALTNNGAPQCKAGYTAQELTLVAQVSIEQESGGFDKVDSIRVYPDRTRVSLPGNSFVPGHGWVNAANTTINFDTAWGSQSTASGRTPARPMRIVFFKFGPNTIYQSVDLTGGQSVNVPNKVPYDASMMIYFDGPIDYRSFSGVSALNGSSQYFYDRNLTGCKFGNNWSCNIRLFSNAPGFPMYTGLQVVPILPYATKLLLLAPLGNNLSTGKSYHLDINYDALRSFSYAAGSPPNNNPAMAAKQITFTTQ